MPKGDYHHGDLRNALLDAGEKLIATQDSAELSLRAVTREAGVSANAPYRHFKNKDALLAAVAERGIERLSDQLRRVVVEGAQRSVQERLAALAHTWVTFALDNPGLYSLMVHTPPSEGLRSSGAATRSFFADHLRAILPEGTNTDAVVLSGWSLVHGLTDLLLYDRIPGVESHNRAAVADKVATITEQLARLLH